METQIAGASLTHFPSATSSGAGVLVLPGGGYGGLAIGHEGTDVASWLNARGLDAWMLRYSVAESTPTPLLHRPLQQAQGAVSFIRKTFAPRLLGAWGFSAGGHLCATLATSAWEETRGLDFHILAYPVITMGEHTHGGSRANLLGASPCAASIEEWSGEKRISLSTSPCFLFHTWDDTAVPVENALLYLRALRAHRIAVEAHLYESGPHGVGLAPNDPVLSTWTARLEAWLVRRGAIKSAQ
jgi:acetyl esterase/lipase